MASFPSEEDAGYEKGAGEMWGWMIELSQLTKSLRTVSLTWAVALNAAACRYTED